MALPITFQDACGNVDLIRPKEVRTQWLNELVLESESAKGCAILGIVLFRHFSGYFAGWTDHAVTADGAGVHLFFIGDVRKISSGFILGHKPFDDVIKS